METEGGPSAPGGASPEGYRPLPGARDEMADAAGRPRAAWRPLAEGLAALSPEALARRAEEARRMIRESGVTYNVYSDPRGLDRPWALDPVPLLISEEEWREIEQGLVQRATALNLLLADLYGPQKLLGQGAFPPELIFANPAFLRACHGIRPEGEVFLHFYAADLARGPDGRWMVVADRTQAPSGAGYALENRIIVSRLFSDAFQDSHVRRLAAHFQRVRDTLRLLAPHDRENPRIVVLTPGPYNETYFEQAYLARYLGYDLVEGGDLAVRDNRVYVKTLGGLRLVDVILRRLDDAFCDPLELFQGSQIGVPGLVQAAHAGGVAIANALGSALAETPALLCVFPAACRELLGEEPLLASPPIFWCGLRPSAQYVSENLSRMVVKPAFRDRGPKEPLFGERLSAAERAALSAAIAARPYDYVGQERVEPATAPAVGEAGLEPRRFLLRVHLVACDGAYSAMPGGLARVSTSADALVVSLQGGGESKDVWVLSEEPLLHAPVVQPPGHALELRRGGIELPSRAADNLFWLGRYVERCEGAARLLRAVLARLSDEAGREATPELPALLAIVGAGAPAANADADDRREAVLRDVLARVYDEEQPASLRAALDALHRTAWLVRDRISLDAWRVLASLAQDLPEPAAGATPSLDAALEAMGAVVLTLSAFSGLQTESMTRVHAWRFLDMGRRLERALGAIRLLAAVLVRRSEAEPHVLGALLEIADSSMTYRSRYLATVQPAPALDLLLTDETNPRSVLFQLAALEEHVARLPREARGPGLAPEQRIVVDAATRLRLADVRGLAEADAEGRRAELEALLAELEADLPEVSEALTRDYFSHAGAGTQSAGRALED